MSNTATLESVAEPAPAAPAVTALGEIQPSGQLDQANRLVKNYSLGAAGSCAVPSILPLPYVSEAVLAGVQVAMLEHLSRLYGVKFPQQRLKHVAGTLVSSLGGLWFLLPPAKYLLNLVPGVGTVLSYLGYPIVASATTYALGKVFIQHYEAGGTFLSFNPEKTKQYFAEQFQAGLKQAADAKLATR